MNSAELHGNNDSKNKMKFLRDHSFDDEIKNPLLVKYDIDKLGLSPEMKATNTILAEVDQDLSILRIPFRFKPIL